MLLLNLLDSSYQYFPPSTSKDNAFNGGFFGPFVLNKGLLKICSQSKNNSEAFLTKFRSIPKILGARAIASVLDFRGLAKRSVASFLDVNIF